MVTNTAATVRALDAPADHLRVIVEGGSQTLGATARRSVELEQTIARSARVLPTVRTTLTRLNTTLGMADPLLDRLDKAAPDVAPAAKQLRAALGPTDKLLTEARPLLRSLRPAAADLATGARAATPLLQDVRPSLDRLDKLILPDLAVVDPETQRPTYQMIGPTISGLNAAFAYFDKDNSFVRFLASGGERAVDTSPCKTFFTNPGSTKLVTCTNILKGIGQVLAPPPSKKAAKP
jgi:ABC-type transporter Mla subunit MlaD